MLAFLLIVVFVVTHVVVLETTTPASAPTTAAPTNTPTRSPTVTADPFLEIEKWPGNSSFNSYGASISSNVAGDRLAIGDYSGHAWVFEEVDSVWTPMGDRLEEPGVDFFGLRVELNEAGDRLVVLCRTGFYFYTETEGSWAHNGSLISSNAPESVEFWSLAYRNNTVVLGDLHYNLEFGMITVFQFVQGLWIERARHSPDIQGSFFGLGLSLDRSGDTLVVGAPKYDSYDGGFWIFKSSDDWEMGARQTCPTTTLQETPLSCGASVMITPDSEYVLVATFQGFMDTFRKVGDSYVSYVNSSVINSADFALLLTPVVRPTLLFVSTYAGGIGVFDLRDQEWVSVENITIPSSALESLDTFGMPFAVTENRLFPASNRDDTSNGFGVGAVWVYERLPPPG